MIWTFFYRYLWWFILTNASIHKHRRLLEVNILELFFTYVVNFVWICHLGVVSRMNSSCLLWFFTEQHWQKRNNYYWTTKKEITFSLKSTLRKVRFCSLSCVLVLPVWWITEVVKTSFWRQTCPLTQNKRTPVFFTIWRLYHNL